MNGIVSSLQQIIIIQNILRTWILLNTVTVKFPVKPTVDKAFVFF